MISKKNILIFMIVLLVLLQAGLVLLLRQDVVVKVNMQEIGKEPYIEDAVKGENVQELPIHYAYYSNKEFYESAFNAEENMSTGQDEKVMGGILPHHLIVKNEIADFLDDLKKFEYKNIILVAPNHFGSGRSDMLTSRAVWNTPYGDLQPNVKLIEALNESKALKVDERPFVNEHSISGLVGFIKHAFPDAKFVPIIVKEKTSERDCDELADALTTLVDKESTLVLASVDFSHYLPVSVADFHDNYSRGIIENFDFDRISSMEIDSPASIYALLRYLSEIGAEKAKLVNATNSGRLIGDFNSPTTSHNFYYFLRGKKNKSRIISMMFFGDLMIDRHVGEKIDANGLDYIFEKLKGDENRFFRGLDLIGANLEGAVTDGGAHYPPQNAYDFAFNPDRVKEIADYGFNFFISANNHFSDQGERGIIETRKNLDELGIPYVGCKDREVGECSTKIVEIDGVKIGMAAFSMVYGLIDVDRAAAMIKDLATSTDLVIVNMHWGVEYQHKSNRIQADIAHQFIDSGADMIIGHHPHVVQGLEIYKGKLIFYSLGNFVFDQYFSEDTQRSLAVAMSINDDSLEAVLLPLESKASQVSLSAGKKKEKSLSDIISWSNLDEGFVGMVREGAVQLRMKN